MCQISFDCETIFMSFVTFKMRLLCLHHKYLYNKILKYIIYKGSNTYKFKFLITHNQITVVKGF